jgi:multiple sugar transport system substrate-binding protein
VTNRTTRRATLAGLATTPAWLLAGRPPAYAQSRQPFAGTTLNISCFAVPYSRAIGDLLQEFTAATGIRVSYDTPGFPIYNQRSDLELSTRGTAFDVLNITFIYSSRWIGAGWFTPLDDYLSDRNRTPADWDFADILPGVVAPMKDRAGKQFGIPWTVEVLMGGSTRSDILRANGLGMPDDFDQFERAMATIHMKEDLPAYICENNFGWPVVSFIHGFGGNVFRNPPDDLFPTLDTPETIEGLDFIGRIIRQYGPPQAVGYNPEQTMQAFRNGRVQHQHNNHSFLVPAVETGSRVRDTAAFSLFPTGPRGRFPGIATHAWGIPAGSRNKDAAWEFIKWAMSKEMLNRLVNERGIAAVPRKSVMDAPDYRARTMVNGHDIAKIVQDTLELGAQGHMKYRTVHVYPQVNAQLNQIMERLISGQMTAREACRQGQQNALADLRRAGLRF